MLTQSDAAIAAWRATERTLDAKVSIADNDGNVTDYGTTDVTSIAYDSGAFSGDTFSIGSTYENNMTVTFAHLVEGLQQGYKVTAKIGIKLPDGTYEYCPLGVFIISDDISMDRNNDITTIKCYDQFCVMEGTYTSSLTYPAKVVDVIAEIANKAGVVLNTGDIAKLPTQADIASAITGQTYRVAISWIAQFYGGFALFDRDGKLTIRTIASSDYILDPSQYEQSGLTKNEATYKIGGMSVSVTTTTTDSTGESSETTLTLTAGSTSGSQIELTNNIMTQDRLGIIWSTIKDITFYPYSVTWFGNPAIEAGDWLTLKDTKGNVFNVPNSSYTMTFDGGLTATSKADQTSTSSSSYSYSGTLSQTVKQLAGRQGATGNYIYGEDVTEDPADAKIGDQWYKKNGNKTELWQYVKQSDGTGKWTLIVSDLTSVEITAKVDTAMADVDTAKQNASTAVETANTAINNASVATNTAQNAADTATAVQQQVISLKGGSTLTIAELESGLSTKVSSDDFNSYRTQTDNALVDKVSSSDFTSYRTQTDSAIQERITSVDAESLVTTATNVWQVKLSTLQTQVNNSAVGTNLLLNTTSFDRSDTSNFLGKWNYDPNKSGLDRGGNMVINMLNDTSGYSDVTQFINADPLTDYMYSIRLIWSQNNSTHGNFATLIAVEYKDSNMNLTDVYSDHELIIGNSVDVNKTSMHFKTQPDCKYIKFYIRAFYGWYIAFTKPKVEKGTTVTDYSANPADNATNVALTAVNTSLTSAINLRVQKNDVINQINVSSEGILIDGAKVHITGTTTIDNAVIKSAMIDSLSASKLTAGTIDASLINVINLNANNITAGTLTGVAFHQKSSDMETWIDNNGIHNYDDSGDNVWIKEGGFKIYNSSDEGIFMKGGQLTLTDLDTWGTIATIGTNKKPPTDSYGIIDSKLDIGLSGIRVHGGGGAALLRDSASGGGQTADVTTIGYWGISNGGGFSATNFLAQMGGDTSWVAGIQAGSRYGAYMTSQPSIVVGTANWADTITDNTNVGPNTVISSGGIWLNSGGGVIVNAPSNFEVRSGGFIATAAGSHIRNTQIDNELWVNGVLNVSGAKNAIVKTSLGWAQINAYETAEYYFGDMAKVNTGSGSKVKVMMDKLFLETVNTKIDYHVFLSSYGNGYAWVSEQGKDYFIIESNVPNLEVSYEVKAKRLGYENTRLEIDEDFEQKFDTAS
ncbi:hypothetical protein [Liquorilactobacillus hordei]|uniref:hypothetical protein n=1 Tax=Liquorilactobacillus hordei TaxID=468911 RepID=UPI0039EAD21D